MKKWPLLLALSTLTLSLSGCFEPLPVKQINYASVPVNIHSAAQVQKAIKIGAQALHWKTSENARKITAIKDSSHNQIVVSIPYSSKGYKILLQNVTNMGYDPKKNTINAEYNDAITKLNNAIQVNLYAQ